jgi:hypothetical protein
MSNLHCQFDAASVTPCPTNCNPFASIQNLGNQELSDFINAATDMLRHRGFPPPARQAIVQPLLQVPHIPSPPVPSPTVRIPPPPPPRNPIVALAPSVQPAVGGSSQSSPPMLNLLPQQNQGSLPPPSRSSDMWENVKIEQIICSGIKPIYDGTPDNLIPTLNSIQIRRRNEVWYPATFMVQDGKSIDLIR